MMIRPIIFGATGMVGEGVLHLCLQHPHVEKILIVSRKPTDHQHEKLKEIIHRNFFDFSSITSEASGYNACFFCLGVTSVGKSEQQYTAITYDITMAAARTLAPLNPDMTFCYVSGAGTDSTEQGRIMWARVKGKTENDVAKLPFKAAYAIRPGFIKPIKGLKKGYTISRALGALYPFLNLVAGKYVCTLEEVGLSMVHVAQHGYEKHILECVDLQRLGKPTITQGLQASPSVRR